MLAHSIAIADRSIGTHARHLQAAIGLVASKSASARAFVGAVCVDALRVGATAGHSFAAFVNVIAALSLERVVNAGLHDDALRVMAMVARWTWVASEAGREVLAAHPLVTRLDEIALLLMESVSEMH
jgi:hypothetical protein